MTTNELKWWQVKFASRLRVNSTCVSYIVFNYDDFIVPIIKLNICMCSEVKFMDLIYLI